MAALTANGVGTCGADDNQAQAGHLIPTILGGGVTHTLTNEGHDASEDGTGRGTPIIAQQQLYSIMPMNSGTDYKARQVDVAQPLMTAPTGGNQGGDYIVQPSETVVRRLTEIECERLQGYPDCWTEGQSAAARYRQLGNSVAVPVVEWIAHRLVAIDAKEGQSDA